MTKGLKLIFLIMILNSCSSPPETEQEKREAMNHAYFDQNLIRNVRKYENLKIFLEHNIDTIINFRYRKNIVSYARGNSQVDSYLSDDNCYNFFQGNDEYDITNVPAHLKKNLDSLFHSFNEQEINSFEVCKDKKIRIEIKRERFENGLALLHMLIWNTKTSSDFTYLKNKDTVINNCIYRIGLTKLGR